VMSRSASRWGFRSARSHHLSAIRAVFLETRAMRLDSVMLIDHSQNLFPTAIWDAELTWLAAQRPTPHEFFDY
jgi:phthiodiolone/phenolphthiodiolone dimycocerosates ketoreductase